MKKAIIAVAILFIAAGSGNPTFAADKNGKGRKHQTVKKYTCPMHAEVVQTRPGKCPKCGMKLELVKADKKK